MALRLTAHASRVPRPSRPSPCSAIAPQVLSLATIQAIQLLPQLSVFDNLHMALANTHRAYVLAKGTVVLHGPSSELAGNPDLIASYLGEATGQEGQPADKRGRRRTAPSRGGGRPARLR